MYLLVAAGSLLAELVAGEVENGETVGMMFFIKLLQLFILRGETALGGGVYDENHFVGVLFQRYGAAFSVFDREIIDGLHYYIG